MGVPRKKKLLVVQVAALGDAFLREHRGPDWNGLAFKPVASVFPAVTCSVQASFRTASRPADHGMIGNGFVDRRLGRAFFWEQSAALVTGDRIWSRFREHDKKVAVLFWQQSMGEAADLVLSPAPIHRHHGGIIEDCHSTPAGLYGQLCEEIGRPFALKRYWGPLASAASSAWIAEAVCRLLRHPKYAPDLCLAYLPALDYDLQRFGPQHRKSQRALADLFDQLGSIRAAAEETGYDLLVFGDYAITRCDKAALPNVALREAGLLSCRSVRGMQYADLRASRAFALADHQVAHVYVRDPADCDAVRTVLWGLPEIADVLDRDAQQERGVAHPSAGDLVALAEPNAWIAYPWWTQPDEAPDYAGHVDIHNKPGYDPCELFFGWPPGSVSRNLNRVRGTHGLVSDDTRTCWTSTFLQNEPATLVELAEGVRDWLNEGWL